MWSWRDSNSRPNKQYASFLHAYSAIHFRYKADSRPPTLYLSSKVFVIWSKLPNAYFCISMPQNRTLQNRTSVRHLVSLLYFGKNANLTKLRIKQQEQTLRCQLNCAARDLRDRAAVLCMLTYPLFLLSKPVSPQLDKAAKIQKILIFTVSPLYFGRVPLLCYPNSRVGLYVTIFAIIRRRSCRRIIAKDFLCNPSRKNPVFRKFLTIIKSSYSKKIIKPVKVG